MKAIIRSPLKDEKSRFKKVHGSAKEQLDTHVQATYFVPYDLLRGGCPSKTCQASNNIMIKSELIFFIASHNNNLS